MKENFIVDKENKKVYADMQALGKKDVAKVDAYVKQGYELMPETQNPGFVAPLNMGVQQSNAAAFPMF